MEAIDTKAIKDAVAKKHGYKTFNEFLFDNWLHDQEMNEVIDEVISEVAKQVAERQKEICYQNAKIEAVDKEPDTQNFWNFFNNRWLVPNKESILNAPIPEIK